MGGSIISTKTAGVTTNHGSEEYNILHKYAPNNNEATVIEAIMHRITYHKVYEKCSG